MSQPIEVYITLCRESAKVPEYARSGDAGMDIYAAEEVTLGPGQTVIIPTGIKLAIPEGYEIQVRPRSGISFKTPLRLSNAPGTIDSGYRDELGVIMTNTSDVRGEEEKEILTLAEKHQRMGTYLIQKGDRIAQIVLQEVPRMKLIQVASVSDIGNDRGGGFGSTGTK